MQPLHLTTVPALLLTVATACRNPDADALAAMPNVPQANTTTGGSTPHSSSSSDGDAYAGNTTQRSGSRDDTVETTDAAVGPTCEGARCYSTLESRWQGPFVPALADVEASCTDAMLSLHAQLFLHPHDGEWNCTCTCGESECRDTVRVRTYNGSTCAGTQTSTCSIQGMACSPPDGGFGTFVDELAVASCWNQPIGSSYTFQRTASPCGEGVTALNEIEPPSHGASLALCGPVALAEGCSPGERCIGRPDINNACVIADGDQDCPVSFPEKVVGYSALNDARSCAPCGCEQAEECPTPPVRMFTTDCPPPGDLYPSSSYRDVSEGSCGSRNDNTVGAFRVLGAMPDATVSCGGTYTVDPAGGITRENPQTVCCMSTLDTEGV